MEKGHLKSLRGGKPANELTGGQKLEKLQRSLNSKTIDSKESIRELGAGVQKAQIEAFRKLAAEHDGEVITVEEATVFVKNAAGILFKEPETKQELLELFPKLTKLIDFLWKQKSPIDNL